MIQLEKMSEKCYKTGIRLPKKLIYKTFLQCHSPKGVAILSDGVFFGMPFNEIGHIRNLLDVASSGSGWSRMRNRKICKG